MVIEYSIPRISLISSYIIATKTLILSLICKRRSSYFPAKKRTWSERLTLILRSFLKLESFGYNNNKGNVSELVIITEVKFIKKFLHAVCENCHVQKCLKIKVYIVNHKGNVHDKQSLMIISSSFSSCIPLLSQFRKSVGPCPAVYKYNGGRRDNTILHRQKRLLSSQNDHFLYFLTIKALWFEKMKRSRHGDYVNGGV